MVVLKISKSMIVHRFVKKTYVIPTLPILILKPKRNTSILLERVLVGNFTELRGMERASEVIFGSGGNIELIYSWNILHATNN
jgi:hypothetical protein